MNTIKTTMLGLAFTALVTSGIANAETAYFKMSTIAPGSTNYNITAAFAQAANKHVKDVEIQLNATGSVTQHMLAVALGEVDFMMNSTLLAHFMSQGKAMYAKVDNAPELYRNLRSVFNFPAGAFQYVTYADSGIASLHDLKGKTVFLGPPSGGATAFATGMVEAYTGLKAGTDFKLARMGFTAAAQAFLDRKIDVWMTPTLVPGADIAQVALTNKIRLLGIPKADFTTNPELAKVMKLPGRSLQCVAPDAYGANQVNDTEQCFGVSWVGVGTRKGVDEQVVYAITKAFWENIGDLHAQGAGLKAVALDNALNQLNMPLHPGAVRYYRERGLTIPAALLP
jgi:hypothetical protein